MKTVQNQIKLVFLMLSLFFITNVNSQNQVKDKKLFVRVFDIDGHKIGKGHVVKTTDSTLELSRGSKYLKLSLENINYIKTKRSTGSNVLTGGIVGGVTGALIGAVTSEEETKVGNAGFLGSYTYKTGTSSGEGAAIAGSMGFVGGAIIGLGSSLFKNSETLIIDRDKEKWKQIRKLLE